MPAVHADDGGLGDDARELEESQGLEDQDEVEAEEIQPAKRAPDPVLPSPKHIVRVTCHSGASVWTACLPERWGSCTGAGKKAEQAAYQL